MKKIFYVISLLLAMSCSNHINSSSSSQEAIVVFDKEGHRGCRGLMPENTIAAYLKAVDLGVTTLEMDAVITKDSEVVMSHEPFFNHEITTKPNGDSVTKAEEHSLNIYQMTYDEVKAFDVGMKPNTRFPQQQKLKAIKPLLGDVIDSVEAYSKAKSKNPLQYNIETKCSPDGDNIFHPEPGEFVELLMAVINKKGVAERVIIQSFDVRSLQYLHKKYPAIKTSLLIEDFDTTLFDSQIKNLGFIPTIYSPEQSLVTPALIQQCHDAGIKIISWTINDAAKISEFKKMGVDGVISDYPNLF